MKSRTLLQLLVLLLVLGALAYWSSHRTNRRSADPLTGSKALEVGDVNGIARVIIASDTQQVEMVRGEIAWTLTGLWKYPADFGKIADLLRKLDDLKVGEVMRGGTEHLEEFGLARTNLAEGAPVPAEVKLYRDDGALAGAILLGQPRTGATGEFGFSVPDSQYVRMGNGPVILVSPYIESVPRRDSDWMERSILDINAHDVERIEITTSNNVRYGIKRNDQGQYAGLGSLAGQHINVSGAEMWTRCLQGLTVGSVLDPAADRAAIGLDQPDVTTVRTRDGLVVTARLGHEMAPDSGERCATLTVAYDAPANASSDTNAAAVALAAQAKATQLQAKISPWIYLLPRSAGTQLAMLREQLIEVAPAAVETNAAEAAAMPDTSAPTTPSEP